MLPGAPAAADPVADTTVPPADEPRVPESWPAIRHDDAGHRRRHRYRVVTATGEELVGLCYFGDQQSREHVEAKLALKDTTTDFKAVARDSSPPSKTKH